MNVQEQTRYQSQNQPYVIDNGPHGWCQEVLFRIQYRPYDNSRTESNCLKEHDTREGSYQIKLVWRCSYIVEWYKIPCEKHDYEGQNNHNRDRQVQGITSEPP